MINIFRFFNINGALSDLMGLGKLIITIIFIGHMCGCVWHGKIKSLKF